MWVSHHHHCHSQLTAWHCFLQAQEKPLLLDYCKMGEDKGDGDSMLLLSSNHCNVGEGEGDRALLSHQ